MTWTRPTSARRSDEPSGFGPSDFGPTDRRAILGDVMTRVGFLVIFAGAVIYALRAAGLVDTESADIASVLFVVVGALAVAVDGEPRAPKPKA